MYLVASGGRLGDAGRRGAVFLLVERLAEALAGLLDLLLDFLILLGQPILDEHVGAVALLRVAVVDERVVEGAQVTRSLPRFGVHENRRVDADDVLVELDHRVPPVAFDIVFQLDAVLAVIVDSSQTVVDFARRKYESVLLAVSDQLLEKFLLSHSILILPDFRTTKVQN